MRAITAVCASAISSLGRGRDAYRAGDFGEEPRTGLAIDPSLGTNLRHPLVGRVTCQLGSDAPDRAQALLLAAASDLALQLDRLGCSFRRERLAIVLGTSAAGMPSIEAALQARARGALCPEGAARAAYFAPLAAVEAELGVRAVVVQILAACASSTVALGLGCRWLEAGLFDWVIAGGYDALSGFVASGFDALGALTKDTPLPFREDRDGMALGEGAALVALHNGASSAGLGRVLGFGMSADAVHITAPDATGTGLARAAQFALEDAGFGAEAIDLVSAHGTATRFNDAAETNALRRIFGSRRIPLLPFKAVIGHTLGAAGALEALSAWDALACGMIPAVPGRGAVLDDRQIWLARVHERSSVRTALKLSAAFGGTNAALVLGRQDAPVTGSPRSVRPVALAKVGPPIERADPELLGSMVPQRASVLSRLDGLSELVLAAAARLLRELAFRPGPRTAVIVGTASATLECNEQFDRRRREGLPVEPRRFPATSPNVCAGWCSIAFGFTGPSFCVASHGDPRQDALLLGHDLIQAGDADAALVIAAEDAGPVVSELFGRAGHSIPRRGAQAILLVSGDQAPGLRRSELAWPGPH